MKSPSIAFFDSKDYEIAFFDKEAVKTGIKFSYFKDHLDSNTVTMSKGFDGICAFVNDDLSRKVIKS